MNEQRQEEELRERAVEMRRQYYREYRARNKERVKQWNAAYWAKKAQREKAAEKAEP